MFACIALVALVNCKPASFRGTAGSNQAPTSTNEATPPQIGIGDSPDESLGITSTVPGGTTIGGNPPGEQSPAGNPPLPDGTAEQPLIIGSPPSTTSDSDTAISPANGSTVCLQPAISVNLGLTDATRKEGALDMTKIKLMVDGVDVTARATAIIRRTVAIPRTV